MSDETKAALAAAIQGHIADERGEEQILTDWVVTAASINLNRPAEDKVTGYLYTSEGTHHAVRGLTSLQAEWLESTEDVDP